MKFGDILAKRYQRQNSVMFTKWLFHSVYLIYGRRSLVSPL